jgi:hypothetical protein
MALAFRSYRAMTARIVGIRRSSRTQVSFFFGNPRLFLCGFVGFYMLVDSTSVVWSDNSVEHAVRASDQIRPIPRTTVNDRGAKIGMPVEELLKKIKRNSQFGFLADERLHLSAILTTSVPSLTPQIGAYNSRYNAYVSVR